MYREYTGSEFREVTDCMAYFFIWYKVSYCCESIGKLLDVTIA